MRRPGLFLLLFSLGVTGCAAPSQVMINDQGKQVQCGAVGVGWLGAPMAIGMYADCVNRAKAVGFVGLT